MNGLVLLVYNFNVVRNNHDDFPFCVRSEAVYVSVANENALSQQLSKPSVSLRVICV